MSVGALVMSVSTIVVAANAQLLRGLKLRPEEPASHGRRRATAGLISALLTPLR